MSLRFTHHDFTKWNIRDVPAFWLAEMIEESTNPKYRIELARRVGEMRREDERESIEKKREVSA